MIKQLKLKIAIALFLVAGISGCKTPSVKTPEGKNITVYVGFENSKGFPWKKDLRNHIRNNLKKYCINSDVIFYETKSQLMGKRSFGRNEFIFMDIDIGSIKTNRIDAEIKTDYSVLSEKGDIIRKGKISIELRSPGKFNMYFGKFIADQSVAALRNYYKW